METSNEFYLTSAMFGNMICLGAMNLRSHASEINDLNVFPVPDGDTGDNMLSTLAGGAEAAREETFSLGEKARRVADGMLLSARGNSGVILSQFFCGIADGFEGLDSANVKQLKRAFRKGVKRAYSAVMKPAEGTILTVAKEATEYACATRDALSVVSFMKGFVDEARRSLDRTPDLLPVLREAGVVDSGGAGLLCIVEGMCIAFDGEMAENAQLQYKETERTGEDIDIDKFTEDDVLLYGYCTELLVRLQRAKCDIDSFDTDALRQALSALGDSVVAVRSGSVLKLHIHTATPHLVFELCQRYGEFLKVKVENMSLQHNSLEGKGQDAPSQSLPKGDEIEKKRYGVVVVASGEGIKRTFLECGADSVIDGGQSRNPSAEELLRAYRAVNADTVFVFPNNSNVIMAAKQAGELCTEKEICVIETRNVGEGYSALSMADFSVEDTGELEAQLYENMKGVLTGEIARCVRDAEMQGVRLSADDYIGYVGKRLFSCDSDRFTAARGLADSLELDSHAVCLIFYGRDVDAAEAQGLSRYIEGSYPTCEVYLIEGEQEIYSYILVAQ